MITIQTLSAARNCQKDYINDSNSRCFNETQYDLKSSEYLKNTVGKVLPVLGTVKLERIVCLGLGKVTECPISRHQLAFIRYLQEKLSFDGTIEYFDPVFCEQTIVILEKLGGVVSRENYEGKYSADVATLFYLPHCPKQISNNLLWKNWNSQLLKNVFLIGNSFAGIVENCPKRLLQKTGHFILEVEDFCREIPFDNTFRHKDIFNDTSFHYFDNSVAREKPTKFWNLIEEPQYTDEDLELITRNIQKGLIISDNGNNKGNEQNIEEASHRIESH